MNDHWKKMIAPIGITILFLAYLILYGGVLITMDGWQPVFIILLIPLVALGAGMVYMLVTRIWEIRSGEEDDLSNY